MLDVLHLFIASRLHSCLGQLLLVLLLAGGRADITNITVLVAMRSCLLLKLRKALVQMQVFLMLLILVLLQRLFDKLILEDSAGLLCGVHMS